MGNVVQGNFGRKTIAPDKPTIEKISESGFMEISDCDLDRELARLMNHAADIPMLGNRRV